MVNRYFHFGYSPLIFTHHLVEMSKNKSNGNGKTKGKIAVLVQEINNSVNNPEESITPQLQYFSSDVAIKDTSDGPKVAVHMYGNNDQQTVNRAIVFYCETIEKLESISKEGKKIRLTSK